MNDDVSNPAMQKNHIEVWKKTWNLSKDFYVFFISSFVPSHA